MPQDKQLADLVRKTLDDVDSGLSHEEALYRLRHFVKQESSR